ncbi:hypothetical protein ACQ4PT_067784 [Festuca glaucescens]
MARDFLAIPLSTVASESAFSCGGRILGDTRSSLTPEMLQALVCAKDWLFIPKDDEDLTMFYCRMWKLNDSLRNIQKE